MNGTYLVLLRINLVGIVYSPAFQIVSLTPATGVHNALFLLELGYSDLFPFAWFSLSVRGWRKR